LRKGRYKIKNRKAGRLAQNVPSVNTTKIRKGDMALALLKNRNRRNGKKKQKTIRKKSQLEQAQRDENDMKGFMAELENLEEGQQKLIKIIVERIYEALKESNVTAFASTLASVDIGKEVLKSTYHISKLTWKHEN